MRNVLKSSVSAIALSVGAVGWSSLAYAAEDEAGAQILLSPEQYDLMEDGVVVFTLETGANLSLTADQYLIMEDGLLLVTDEIAQAFMSTAPLVGSVQADLMPVEQPIRLIEGSMEKAQAYRPVWNGVGDAPRLFEQVTFERFELAQATDGGNIASGTVTGATAGASGVAAGATAGVVAGAALVATMARESEEVEESEPEEPEAPAPNTAPPEYFTNAAIAARATTAFTGSSGDTVVGLTPIQFQGYGPGNQATFDMSAGGDNLFVDLSDDSMEMAQFAGNDWSYIGGAGNDLVKLGEDAALGRDSDGNIKETTLSVDFSAGGNNQLIAAYSLANRGGDAVITGGPGDDTFRFADMMAYKGSVKIDLSAGGNNVISAADWAGRSGFVDIIGGPDDDTISFHEYLGQSRFDMSLGGNNQLFINDNAVVGPDANVNFEYIGGSGNDQIYAGRMFNREGAKIDFSAGGNNLFVAEDNADGLQYIGGAGTETIAIEDNSGELHFDMTAGGNYTLFVGNKAGVVSYAGGTGKDVLGFGGPIFSAFSLGYVQVDLGADSAADIIAFEANVAQNDGTILIQNFDASDGDEIIVTGQTTGTVLYSLVGTDDVEVQATNGTATITFTIEDTTISALTSSHYNSGTGLVIS